MLLLGITSPVQKPRGKTEYAGVAELADALDLGSSDLIVGVQVPSPAPYRVFLQDLKGSV